LLNVGAAVKFNPVPVGNPTGGALTGDGAGEGAGVGAGVGDGFTGAGDGVTATGDTVGLVLTCGEFALSPALSTAETT